MATSLQPYRERARAHQSEIDLETRFLTPQLLAKRWSISVTTVKDIPFEELPYTEFGQGLKLKRRRYHPDAVLLYEGRNPDRRASEEDQ